MCKLNLRVLLSNKTSPLNLAINRVFLCWRTTQNWGYQHKPFCTIPVHEYINYAYNQVYIPQRKPLGKVMGLAKLYLYADEGSFVDANQKSLLHSTTSGTAHRQFIFSDYKKIL